MSKELTVKETKEAYEILDSLDQNIDRAETVKQDEVEFRKAMRKSKADLKNLNHNHYAIMDYLLYHPKMTLTQIGKKLNRSVSWMSLVIGSDLFQEELKKRRQTIDGGHRDRLQSRLLVAGDKALDRLEKVLDNDDTSDSVAVTASKNVFTALGFMNTNGGGNGVNVEVNAENAQVNMSPAGVTREMLNKAKDRT